MLCNQCQQGSIHKATIIKTEEVIYLCEECEVFWRTPEDVNSENYEIFVVYMRELGLEGLWTELEDIQQL